MCLTGLGLLLTAGAVAQPVGLSAALRIEGRSASVPLAGATVAVGAMTTTAGGDGVAIVHVEGTAFGSR